MYKDIYFEIHLLLSKGNYRDYIILIISVIHSLKIWLVSAYLPGVEVNHDQEGGSSRVRPFHCTSVWLTPTITPNVGNSNA